MPLWISGLRGWPPWSESGWEAITQEGLLDPPTGDLTKTEEPPVPLEHSSKSGSLVCFAVFDVLGQMGRSV